GEKPRLLGRPGHQELRQPDSLRVALFPLEESGASMGVIDPGEQAVPVYRDQLKTSVQKLEEGCLALASGLRRLSFQPLDREISFEALYGLVNFVRAPPYRPELSLNAQLAHSHYLFRPSEEYLVINGRQYLSLVGMKYPPPTSLAIYFRHFYELDFP